MSTTHQETANLAQPTRKGRRALRKPIVLERTCLSNTHLYRLISQGKFPKPYKLSERVSVWDEDEVDAWLAAKMAG